MFQTQKYTFPDVQLICSDAGIPELLVWKPDNHYIVIGNGSEAKLELNLKKIKSSKICVVKRKTGGCSVFLSPEMIVISMVFPKTKLIRPMRYFTYINSIIIKVLKEQFDVEFYVDGISDIVLNNRKVAGSSIYQNAKIVFVHSVLNVAESSKNIGEYLSHPPREPEYRKKRGHIEFVTSLKDEGFLLDENKFKIMVEKEFKLNSLII